MRTETLVLLLKHFFGFGFVFLVIAHSFTAHVFNTDDIF